MDIAALKLAKEREKAHTEGEPEAEAEVVKEEAAPVEEEKVEPKAKPKSKTTKPKASPKKGKVMAKSTSTTKKRQPRERCPKCGQPIPRLTDEKKAKLHARVKALEAQAANARKLLENATK